MGWRLRPLWLLPWCAACIGVTTGVDYPADLSSPNPVRRTRAAREFALRKDEARALDAFPLLRDPEAQVRLLIYCALTDMGPGARDFGYRPHLEPDVLAGTSIRWEAWWLLRAGVSGGEAPGG